MIYRHTFAITLVKKHKPKLCIIWFMHLNAATFEINLQSMSEACIFVLLIMNSGYFDLQNKTFRQFKDDLTAARDFASHGNKEALYRLCSNQVI